MPVDSELFVETVDSLLGMNTEEEEEYPEQETRREALGRKPGGGRLSRKEKELLRALKKLETRA